MTDENKKIKGTLMFLYLGQLVELGLIESDGQTQLTTKGFDIAIDAFDSGTRLTEAEVIELTPESFFSDGIGELVLHLQKIGFAAMKKDVEEFKKEMNEKEIGSI